LKNIDVRIEKIKGELLGKADAFIITSHNNRLYASNFSSSAGYVILVGGKVFLLLDFRYTEAAEKMLAQGALPSTAEIVKVQKKQSEHIADILSAYSAKNVYYENYTMSCHEFERLQSDLPQYSLIPAEKLLENCRSVKDEDELLKIKKAQSITDKTFEHILNVIKVGISEQDIACEMEYFMRKQGAQKFAFDTICVSGKKSALPHGVPDKTILSNGFLTMDFGAAYEGYCSDMTRTVCVGTPTDEMKQVYQTVLKAQAAAFEAIKANIFGNAVDKAARDVINNAGYEGCFGHGTGHSLGLDIHESPNFSPSDATLIPENAVISVEPGIYLAGKFGVRIEDIVVIKQNGYENLTQSVKDLIII